MKKNVLTIWAKRAVPALALAGLTLTACEKENDKPIYRAPYEKELFFKNGKMDSVQEPVVRKYVEDTACKHIYMVVESDNNYTAYEAEDIGIIRTQLQSRVELSSKVLGRGDFRFSPGLANVNDSVWFVQNGWTVNKCWQR